jgi:PBSX family phage terminase large subunit
MNEFSPKQWDFYGNSDARINILQGAVRSGKTYISLWRWIKELRYGPEGEYAMICRTYDVFNRNILRPLCRMLGAGVEYYSGKREMYLLGKTVFIIGADDERAEAKIRGATFRGAYIDEASILPESVFKMLVSRCAMGGARIFATTNPDSPFHWLYRDYIQGNQDVKSWHFVLDDNPKLTKEEKEYLIRSYKGLWYQRFIEGRWVQAEGAIYDTLDEDIHCIDWAPPTAEYYICGVDYGTTNACSFVALGINKNKYPNVWVDSEYYYDSKVHQRQKTDAEYCDDLKKFTKDRHFKSIYIDPSAASFKQECARNGIYGLFDANNEVVDGIRFVNKYLNNGQLKIARNCKHLIEEMKGYIWDAKAALRGIEKPLKERDHSCDALRYALFSHFYGKSDGILRPEDIDKWEREANYGETNLPSFFR